MQLRIPETLWILFQKCESFGFDRFGDFRRGHGRPDPTGEGQYLGPSVRAEFCGPFLAAAPDKPFCGPQTPTLRAPATTRSACQRIVLYGVALVHRTRRGAMCLFALRSRRAFLPRERSFARGPALVTGMIARATPNGRPTAERLARESRVMPMPDESSNDSRSATDHNEGVLWVNRLSFGRFPRKPDSSTCDGDPEENASAGSV